MMSDTQEASDGIRSDNAPVGLEPTTVSLGKAQKDGDQALEKLHSALPSPEDQQGCPHVADSLPRAVWLVSVVSLCERFCYYSFVGPLQNYIQNSRHDALRPGALGLGETVASLMVNCFLIISYATPMGAAVIADCHLGRIRTITISLGIYIIGVAILFVTSLPVSLSHGAGLPGLIVAMVTISVGLGGIKATLPPFLAEQCGKVKTHLKVNKKGVKEIVDHDATVAYAFDVYYWCYNIGAQARIASTFIELNVGFWASYLISLCSICLGLLIFILSLGNLTIVDQRPQGSILPPALKSFWIAGKHGFRMDEALPDRILSRDGEVVAWTCDFIEQLKAVLFACRAFVPFIIYWLCQAQMTTNTISQAAEMQTHGIPNDMLPNINSATVIIFLPLATFALYPALLRANKPLRPLTRITIGFFLEGLGMAWAAGVQAYIYASPPCYSHPRACPASHNGSLPNNVNIGVQAPVYVLEGLSEIFASPAGYEYAFTHAPKSMKSIVQAIFALTAAGGSVIGLALSPTYKDPDLLGMYAGLAGAMLGTTVLFAVIFSRYNR